MRALTTFRARALRSCDARHSVPCKVLGDKRRNEPQIRKVGSLRLENNQNLHHQCYRLVVVIIVAVEILMLDIMLLVTTILRRIVLLVS